MARTRRPRYAGCMAALARKSPLVWWKLLLGPALATIVMLLAPGDDPKIAAMAAVAVWMAAWWITEAIPIPATSLLPLVLMPLFGIDGIKSVAPNYARSVIFLFLGGFLLALGLQASGAHRRLALSIVHRVGGQPTRIVLGFMLATALLSMWISNTATVMVLMPIGLAVLASAKEQGADASVLKGFGVALMLGIAYAADIGGMATLVGTPPNISYAAQLERLFPDAPAPSFAQWTMLALPGSIVFLGVGWWILTRFVFRMPADEVMGGRDAVAALRAEQPRLGRDEVITGLVFGFTALLWMTRQGFTFGNVVLPGWSRALGLEKGFVDDAVVAIAMALALFVIPSRQRPGEALLTWEHTKEVPWGMLLLFGGGFALAAGFKSSGLSSWVGEQFTVLEGAPTIAVVVVVCVVLTFLTELTSNTATTELVLPVLAAAGVALDTDPRALMIPATLSASCAFMMPVASPTQAIVFGSGYVPIRDMVRAGIWFNLLGIALVTLGFWLLAGPVMGIDFGVRPPWATH